MDGTVSITPLIRGVFLFQEGIMDEKEIEKSIKKDYINKPYTYIYRKYRASGGVTKKVLRNIIANKLLYNDELIELNDLKDIVDNVELETVWGLASNARSDIVRDVCMDRLETYIENRDNYLMEKKKIKDKKLKKELKIKYGGNL
jgi:hypothetical protein